MYIPACHIILSILRSSTFPDSRCRSPAWRPYKIDVFSAGFIDLNKTGLNIVDYLCRGCFIRKGKSLRQNRRPNERERLTSFTSWKRGVWLLFMKLSPRHIFRYKSTHSIYRITTYGPPCPRMFLPSPAAIIILLSQRYSTYFATSLHPTFPHSFFAFLSVARHHLLCYLGGCSLHLVLEYILLTHKFMEAHFMSLHLLNVSLNLFRKPSEILWRLDFRC